MSEYCVTFETGTYTFVKAVNKHEAEKRGREIEKNWTQPQGRIVSIEMEVV